MGGGAMRRVFLGLDLPDQIRSALAVQQFLLPLPKKVPSENFHLTLAFLGEVTEPLLEALHEDLLIMRAAPFDLALAGLGLFGGERPRAAWAGVAASDPLIRLQAKVEHLARQAGCTVEHRRFVPHVTLGRFPPPPLPDALRLERAIAEGAGFAAGPWQVTAVALYESHLGAKGARYEVLAEYPLTQFSG